LEHEVRALLPRRVRQRAVDLLHCRDPVPGRLERAVAARLAQVPVVLRQALAAGLPLHLGALDLPAAALRPAHEPGVEGAAAALPREHPGHGARPLLAARRMIPILFAAFGLLALGCALMVILHKNPVTSALFLVLTFCSLAGLYLLLQAEFVAMVQV